jgi:membrane-associated phospholipid phosphatase
MAKVKTAAKTLHRTDRAVSRQASKKKDTAVVRAAGFVGDLADQPPLIIFSSATMAFGLLSRRRNVAEAGARMLASHLLATALKTLVKRNIDRTRPEAVSDGKAYKLAKGHSSTHDASSFPSGHTAGAVAVARAASRIYPDAVPALATATVGVGALQLPTGKHYVSDVLAGAVVGLVGEALVDGAARLIPRR